MTSDKSGQSKDTKEKKEMDRGGNAYWSAMRMRGGNEERDREGKRDIQTDRQTCHESGREK
jgi:hypothetical protein